MSIKEAVENAQQLAQALSAIEDEYRQRVSLVYRFLDSFLEWFSFWKNRYTSEEFERTLEKFVSDVKNKLDPDNLEPFNPLK